MSGAPEEQSKTVVQHAFSPASRWSGCCISIFTSDCTGFPTAHLLDHSAIGMAGFAVMVATALTFTFCVLAVAMPNKFIRGVRNTGVVIDLTPSRATRTPLAVPIGSL